MNPPTHTGVWYCPDLWGGIFISQTILIELESYGIYVTYYDHINGIAYTTTKVD